MSVMPAPKITHIRLLGEAIEVTRHAHFWISPYDGIRYMLGRTRVEAIAELEAHQAQKSAVKERIRRELRAAPLLPDEVYRKRYYGATFRAKRDQKSVLTWDEFTIIIRRAGGRCELTRIPFSMERDPGVRMASWAPSLDRMDCSKGYEFDNCRLVCTAVNVALSDCGAAALRRIAHGLLGYSVD